MMIGYARTSTLEQVAGFNGQLLALSSCDQIFKEQISSRAGERIELKKALNALKEGDVLIVTKLDRLARSTKDLLQIEQEISKKGASLRILDLNIDTATATGRLLFTMVGAIAEFELALMKERQREGIKKAKADGKYKGGAPIAAEKAKQIKELKAQGKGGKEIARLVGVGRATVYRVLARG
jgi:DNA invertase Pin-like site-specific DNA recombinase